MKLLLNDLSAVNPEQPVSVHWNFHRKCFSVKQGGLVKAHVTTLRLSAVAFHVSQAGRLRVLAEKRKNVHAHIKGTISTGYLLSGSGIPVSYNPYRANSFVSEGKPCYYADFANLTGGKVFIGKEVSQ